MKGEAMIWYLFGIYFTATLITGCLEIIRNERNPLPKFKNADRSFDQIPVIKTHKIILHGKTDI